VSWAECATCWLRFTSDTAFDKHRVLVPREQDLDPPTRRCLSIQAMTARGFRQNDRGWWTNSPPLPQDAHSIPPGRAERAAAGG
jgi:hypothetical protein